MRFESAQTYVRRSLTVVFEHTNVLIIEVSRTMTSYFNALDGAEAVKVQENRGLRDVIVTWHNDN